MQKISVELDDKRSSGAVEQRLRDWAVNQAQSENLTAAMNSQNFKQTIFSQLQQCYLQSRDKDPDLEGDALDKGVEIQRLDKYYLTIQDQPTWLRLD